MADNETQSEPQNEPEYLRPEDVQRIGHFGKSTFWKLIQDGQLPHVRIKTNSDGKRAIVRVSRQALDDFMKAHTVGGEQSLPSASQRLDSVR